MKDSVKRDKNSLKRDIGITLLVGFIVAAGVFFVTGCEEIEQLWDEISNNEPDSGETGDNGDQGDHSTPNSDFVDEIDLSTVTWKHQNVSGWEVVSDLNVNIGGGWVRLNYDKASVWPRVNAPNGGDPIVGNPWIFIPNDEGGWDACTWEWLRPGQQQKPMRVVNGKHIKVKPYTPTSGWKPTSGQVYGWMVSTPARGGTPNTLDHRTRIVLFVWP